MPVSSSVKNLIFDLGGVILDLSVDATLFAFAKLSGLSKIEVEKIFHSADGFLLYEKGLLSDAEFRIFVRQVYSIDASDDQIDACWNTMLRGIPVSKLNLLNRLKARYQVYLLSNTNGIHLNYINNTMLPPLTGQQSLDVYFHQAYYSHRMKKRKPDAEIFHQVLDENRLLPQETLFLDDNPGNIAGAKLIGIQTLLVDTPELVLKYFHA